MKQYLDILIGVVLSFLAALGCLLLAPQYPLVACIAAIAGMLAAALFHAVRSRRTSQEHIRKLSQIDTLTGASNFEKFKVDVMELLSKRRGEYYSLWYCDIKNFKYINDIFGYDIGDKVLRYWAQFIEDSANTHETFARVSADNFVLLRTYESRDELAYRFKDDATYLANFPDTRLHNYRIDLCAGIYCIEKPEDILSVADMLDRANISQKSIKYTGGSQMAFYHQEMWDEILWEKEIESSMEGALQNGEFEIYFQPQVDIQNNNVVTGMEAFPRWHHPKYGLLPPSKFIPAFEKNGFIVKVDLYVFERVCLRLRQLLDRGRPVFTTAVNISRVDMLQADFVEQYVTRKQQYNIPDGLLELEFTESTVFDNHKLFRDIVVRLKENGFLCALDDFGAGHSSLNVLKELPVDVLKLDMLFFRKGENEQRDHAIVASVVAMGRALHMKTVAEGVELPSQVEFLRRLGCNTVQGYIFAKPVPAKELDMLIDEIAKKQLPVPKRSYEASPLWEGDMQNGKYRAALKFVKGIVVEVDFNQDIYHIVSREQKTLWPDLAPEGTYSDYARSLIELFVHPDDREALIETILPQGMIAAFYRDEKEISHEFRVLHPNGFKWVTSTVMRLPTANYKDLRSVLFLCSTDEQHRQQKQLARTQHRLSFMMQDLYIAFMEVDLTSGNMDFTRIKGIVQAPFSHMLYDDLVRYFADHLIAPESKQQYLIQADRNHIADSLKNGETRFYFEYKMRLRPDSEDYRWYASTFFLDNSHTEPTAIGFIQDVNHIKLTEEAAVRESLSKHQMELVVNNIPGGVLTCRANESMEMGFISSNLVKMLGYGSEHELRQAAGNQWSNLIHPADRDIPSHIDPSTNHEYSEYRVTAKDGRTLWLLDYERIIKNDRGESWYYCIMLDVTLTKQVKSNLQLVEKRYQFIMDKAEDLICDWDFKSDVLFFSPVFLERYGYSDIRQVRMQEILTAEIIHTDDLPAFEQMVFNLRKGTPYMELSFRLRRKTDGGYFWCRLKFATAQDDDGEPVRALGIGTDIDEDMRKTLRLRSLAETDPLTGLLNRRAVEDQIRQFIQEESPRGAHSLMIVDLDNFKHINDEFGHPFGDEVLLEVSRRLKSSFRQSDIIGRIGGDEFLVFLKNVPSPEFVQKSAEKIVAAISSPMHIGDHRCQMTCSIGIALYPDNGAAFELLYRNSDQALYQAKAEGKNAGCFYQTGQDALSYSSSVGTIEAQPDSSAASQAPDLLIRVLQLLDHSQELDSSVAAALQLIGTHLRADRIFILEGQADSKNAECIYEWYAEHLGAQKELLRYVPDGFWALGQKTFERYLDENGVFSCPDVQMLPEVNRWAVAALGITSFLMCKTFGQNEDTRMQVVIAGCKQGASPAFLQTQAIAAVAKLLCMFIAKQQLQGQCDGATGDALQVYLESAPSTTDPIIYIVARDTHELLYIRRNDQAFEKVKSPCTCYKALMGKEQPCEHCPIRDWVVSGAQSVSYKVAYFSKSDQWMEYTTSGASWVEGRPSAVLLTRQRIDAPKEQEA